MDIANFPALAHLNDTITLPMLNRALEIRFKGKVLDTARETVGKMLPGKQPPVE